MHLAVAISCVEMNQTSGDIGEQEQGQGFRNIFFHIGKVLLLMTVIIPNPKSVEFSLSLTTMSSPSLGVCFLVDCG